MQWSKLAFCGIVLSASNGTFLRAYRGVWLILDLNVYVMSLSALELWGIFFLLPVGSGPSTLSLLAIVVNENEQLWRCPRLAGRVVLSSPDFPLDDGFISRR
jgi:hypothetical protein